MKLTQQIIKENLSYDSETGIFTCIKPSRTRKTGMIAGGLNTLGYITISIENVRFYAHRMAWIYMYGDNLTGQIDHINGNRSDNRICNLRDVSALGNQQNLRTAQKNNHCGLLGVSFDKRNKYRKWKASIFADGKRFHLGSFHTKEEAHKAYLAKKRQLHETCSI